jgi:hypothetical protein
MLRRVRVLDRERRDRDGRAMSLLLPQNRAALVLAVRPVDIHGDRYVDVTLRFDDHEGPALAARVCAADCPADLREGERVDARIVMGVVTRLART